MRRYSAIRILAAFLSLIAYGGCSDSGPGSPEAIRATRKYLEGQFDERLRDIEAWAKDPNRSYLLARRKATFEHLESMPDGSEPFVISSILMHGWREEAGEEGSAANLTLAVDWVTCDQLVVGIVLAESPNAERLRFPAFGDQFWDPTQRRVLYQDGYLPCMIDQDPDAAIRLIAVADGNSKVLVLPSRSANRLHIAVYDEEERVSNFVRVATYGFPATRGRP